MPYIHFTEEQKLRANAADLVEFLRFKGELLIREGSEFRLSSNHSVTVRGSEWYDHATEKGAPREKVKKPFELPPANENNRRVFAYLLKHRHLDRDVLTTFVRSGLIYEDQKYHNAVFVGRDNDGAPRHAHKRSTNSQGKTFRMTAEGSDFRYAFNWPGTSGHLLVFEAPIDMLSLISVYHDSDWAKHSYVALCGTSSQPLLGMLERHPNIENVLLCLDNDQAGQLATRRLAAVVRERGLTVDARVPVNKDWNEDLCANFQQAEEQQFEQKLS